MRPPAVATTPALVAVTAATFQAHLIGIVEAETHDAPQSRPPP